MDMRNRHDGPDSTGWWDALPPRIRERVTPPGRPEREAADPAPPPAGPLGRWVRRIGPGTALFLFVVVIDVIVLALALAFLEPDVRLPGIP